MKTGDSPVAVREGGRPAVGYSLNGLYELGRPERSPCNWTDMKRVRSAADCWRATCGSLPNRPPRRSRAPRGMAFSSQSEQIVGAPSHNPVGFQRFVEYVLGAALAPTLLSSRCAGRVLVVRICGYGMLTPLGRSVIFWTVTDSALSTFHHSNVASCQPTLLVGKAGGRSA